MFVLKSSFLLLAVGSVSNAWSFNKSSGPVHPEKRSGPVLDSRQVKFPDLDNAVGKAVCSAILSISPYAATSTVYTSTDVQPSYTSTSVSVTETTTTPATVTVPDVVSTNVVTNSITDATSTITPMTTTTTTSYTQTVTTTSRFNNKGGARAAKRAVDDDKFTSLSNRLQSFSSTRVSSSCSAVVKFKTSTLSAVTTTTSETYTLTTTTVTDVAPTPTVSTPTTTLTTTTEHDTATVTIATVTSTLVIPSSTIKVVNKCGPTMNIRYFQGRALNNRKQVTTDDTTSEACCESCNKTPGCSYWAFGDGKTCYIGKVTGSPDTQSDRCPAGTSKFQYTSGNAYVAGYGLCGSS